MWPILRTPAPIPFASPSQTVASAWPNVVKTRKIGPGPLRTARGAGRLAADFAAGRFDAAGFRRAWLVPDDRVREVEPPLVGAFFGPAEDVLLLRDPGGEDVRVAMFRSVHTSHTSHRLHTPPVR